MEDGVSFAGFMDGSGRCDFLTRRCSRAGVSVLEFDRVSGNRLPHFDSFNVNDFASSKLLWWSKKLLISDRAASSSSDVMICLPPLLRRFGCVEEGGHALIFLYRFILSFQFGKIGIYMPYNLILSYK
jgi:hypothetical protein